MSALMVEASDGSKTVMAEKNRQREDIIRMLRLLGRYVEANCKNDMAIFMSSGFQPISTIRTAPLPLAPPTIRNVDHGRTADKLLFGSKHFPVA
jgi:hypothetical protein